MLKLAYASLDEVPENLRGICAVENGSVSLDETKLKTAADVENVLKAKRMEVEAHNETKTRLAAWEKLGRGVDEVQGILDEYPALKGGAKTNKEYLEERKNHQQAIRELDAAKETIATLTEKNKELLGYKVKSQKSAAWKVVRDELAKKFDGAKLDMMFEDNEDNLEVDEIGEFKPYKGKTVREFFTKRAEAFGWMLPNTSGGSNPGDSRIPAQPKPEYQPTGGGVLEDNEKALLDQ